MTTNTNDNVQPITSPEMLSILSDSLERLNPAYAVILKILIETDIPLSRLLEKKVSDIRDRKEITYPGRKHVEIIREEPMSAELQALINEHLKDRSPDDLAFTGISGEKKMHPEVFRLALKNISSICGFNPPATCLMLHKTYLYNTYKVDQAKALSHASTVSRKEFLRYIHMDDTAVSDPSKTDVKETFYSSKILDKTSRNFTNIIQSISENTQRPDTHTPDYYRKVLRFLYSVDEAMRRFLEANPKE